MLRSTLAAALAAGVVLSADALAGQLVESDWTERPDRYAPPSVRGDLLSPVGGVDLRLRFSHRSYQEMFVGTNEVPALLVLQDFDMVPFSHAIDRFEVELGAGIRDWLGIVARLPMIRQEADFITEDRVGRVTTSGLGDAELHLQASLHDRWPVRAHLSAGISLPSGSVDESGVTPDRPQSSRVLPYALQTGSGTVALLPSGTLAVENRYGTVGIQAGGRIHMSENDRDWRPGDSFSGTVWMLYRFNDWVAGSTQLTIERWGDVVGMDPAHDPFASPMHWSLFTGGSRIEIPFGLNIRFADGALEGNRLNAEFIVPVHSDLNGPQLRSDWAFALSWGHTFRY